MTIPTLQRNGPGVRVRSRQLGWTCGACRDHPALAASRNRPSFAVARNCGMGSSSLNADVNAFDRLHMVLDSNSSCWGVFLPIWGKITVDHGVADRLNAASPYRRSHSVYLVPAQSLHGQHRCCTQELLADEPLRRWKQLAYMCTDRRKPASFAVALNW